MQVSTTTWRTPTRADALWFWLRSRGLMLLRAVADRCAHAVSRWRTSTELAHAPVIAEWRSPLWDESGPAEEWALVAGKVHNLRIAVRAFDGVVVPADQTLSFWRQLGRVRRGRGFALGRELRQGCVVPTLGGGLCQLSNALATCAVQAGLRLVERHGHTHAVGTDTAAAIDATVFWNYVDLRLAFEHPWRVEARLSATELIVRLRSVAPVPRQPQSIVLRDRRVARRDADTPAPRGCLTCDERGCFRHQGAARTDASGRTALLLDGWSPEFDHVLRERFGDADWFVPRAARLGPLHVPGRVAWQPASPHHVAWRCFFLRSAWSRWCARDAGRRQAAIIDAQRWLAAAYARRLGPQHAQVVVDQALLPHLVLAGVLQGRRYTVLAHSLPMVEIERRLDAARQRWPGDATLSDFRVDAAVADAELRGLREAQSVLSAHRGVQAWLRGVGMARVEPLDWVLPKTPARAARAATARPLVVFPASALARKGARELASALQGQHCELWVLGTPSSDATLWRGIEVRHVGYASDWLARATVLVLPAHVEHAPRAALMALASGIPVIATPACGLEGMAGLTSVAAGDGEALRAAVTRALG